MALWAYLANFAANTKNHHKEEDEKDNTFGLFGRNLYFYRLRGKPTGGRRGWCRAVCLWTDNGGILRAETVYGNGRIYSYEG